MRKAVDSYLLSLLVTNLFINKLLLLLQSLLILSYFFVYIMWYIYHVVPCVYLFPKRLQQFTFNVRSLGAL